MKLSKRILRNLKHPILLFSSQLLLRKIVHQLRSEVRRKERIIFIGAPLHGNLGDHAIALSMSGFFRVRVPNAQVIEIPGAIFREFVDVLHPFILTSDRIAIIGGGFLGTLWLNEEEMVRTVLRSFPNNRVIIFSQTIYFDESEEGGNEKNATRKLFQSHQDLHLFVRDRSIDFVKRGLCGGNFHDVRPAPDMVLFMDQSKKKRLRSGVLLCFRSDKESIVHSHTISAIKNLLEELDEVYREVDTVLPHNVSSKKRESVLNEKFDEFRRTRLVITDRLHGMIFSAITGTPCIALDNISGKVEGVFTLWLKKLNYIRFAANLDDALTDIPEMLVLGGQEYNPEDYSGYGNDIAELLLN